MNTDCGYYADTDMYAVSNNSPLAQRTDVYDVGGRKISIELRGGELVWLSGKDFSAK